MRVCRSQDFFGGGAFFDVFGINRHRIASFDGLVKKLGNKTGFYSIVDKATDSGIF